MVSTLGLVESVAVVGADHRRSANGHCRDCPHTLVAVCADRFDGQIGTLSRHCRNFHDGGLKAFISQLASTQCGGFWRARYRCHPLQSAEIHQNLLPPTAWPRPLARSDIPPPRWREMTTIPSWILSALYRKAGYYRYARQPAAPS